MYNTIVLAITSKAYQNKRYSMLSFFLQEIDTATMVVLKIRRTNIEQKQMNPLWVSVYGRTLLYKLLRGTYIDVASKSIHASLYVLFSSCSCQLTLTTNLYIT